MSNFLTLFLYYIYNYTWENEDRNLHMVSTASATKGLNPDLALKTLRGPRRPEIDAIFHLEHIIPMTVHIPL